MLRCLNTGNDGGPSISCLLKDIQASFLSGSSTVFKVKIYNPQRQDLDLKDIIPSLISISVFDPLLAILNL